MLFPHAAGSYAPIGMGQQPLMEDRGWRSDQDSAAGSGGQPTWVAAS